MQTILCIYCKKSFEVSEALAHQISEESKKLQEEAIAKAREDERKQAEKKLREESEKIEHLMQDKLKKEEEMQLLKNRMMEQENENRKKLEQALEKIRVEEQERAAKKIHEEFDLQLKNFRQEAEENREKNRKLQEQLLELTRLLREQKEKTEQITLENEKKLLEEREKLRENITKMVEEKAHLEVAELKKKLTDTQSALEDAKRKSQQGSQQLQGEILELDIEHMLSQNFPYDVIEPVEKGVKGADIRQTVKTQIGNFCGVILWEIKRTKRWDNDWIEKLKKDLRNEGANVPVIVSVELPKEFQNGLGIKEGVWICDFSLIIPLAQLLREKLYEVAREKSRNAHSTEKAALLYQYVTSHEFQQQVESMVETYYAMKLQLQKERTALENQWKIREGQIERFFKGTINIVGSIQGRGVSMPMIKGMDILELEDGEN